eukprot:1552200-Rhodomonas_salina.1
MFGGMCPHSCGRTTRSMAPGTTRRFRGASRNPWAQGIGKAVSAQFQPEVALKLVLGPLKKGEIWRALSTDFKLHFKPETVPVPGRPHSSWSPDLAPSSRL